MHFCGRLECQFAATFSREMMRDIASVASLPPAVTMVAS
jgi:hypothetical protein